MKNILPVLALLAVLFVSCNKQNSSGNDDEQANDSLVENNDSTIYGSCVDAAMSSFGLINEEGDTITILLEDIDTIADVQGGLFDGDKLAVIAHKIDGDYIAQKVINITSLRGRWISLDKNFEIKDDGVVQSNVKAETNPYTSWRIWNGLLILSQDTFNILQLGPDSLYLENNNGIYTYKRF